MSERKTFATPTDDEIPQQESLILPVSGLEAQLSGTRDRENVIVLQMFFEDRKYDGVRMQSREYDHLYALTPAAAARLSRDLDDCVQQYLYGVEETESRST